jgi:hypothetical protein
MHALGMPFLIIPYRTHLYYAARMQRVLGISLNFPRLIAHHIS